MRGFKIALGAVVLILLSVVVYQNPHVFWDEKSLQMDLWVWQYHSPDISLAIYFLSLFLIGFLGAYFLSLAERFRTKKTIVTQQQTLQTLEKEVQSLRSSLGSESVAPPEPEESS